MCAWPAARRWWRSQHARPLFRWWGRITYPTPRPPWMPSRWEDTRQILGWWWEKQRTCRLGRHLVKMGSWPYCYRCGKQINELRRSYSTFCAYCAVDTTIRNGPPHADWCPRNDGIPEP